MSRSSIIKGARAILLWSVCVTFLVLLQRHSVTATDSTPAQLASQEHTSKNVAAQNSCPVNVGYGTPPVSEDGKTSIAINGGTSVTLEIEMDNGQDSPCKMKIKFTAPSDSGDTGNGENKHTSGASKGNSTSNAHTSAKSTPSAGGTTTTKGGLPSESYDTPTPMPTDVSDDDPSLWP